MNPRPVKDASLLAFYDVFVRMNVSNETNVFVCICVSLGILMRPYVHSIRHTSNLYLLAVPLQCPCYILLCTYCVFTVGLLCTYYAFQYSMSYVLLYTHIP